MRIAIFTDTFLPQVNGVTNTLKHLADYFEAESIAYILITPGQKETSHLPYNIEKFFSTPFLFYSECRLTIPNMIRMHKRLDAFNPDLLFLMTEFTIGLSGLNYGKKNNIPIISNYSTNFRSILAAYNLSIFENILLRYLKWFHNEAHYTVTPSKESEKVLKLMGIKHTGIFGRGIDFHKFSPNKRTVSFREKLGLNHKIILLYVGRLSSEKDLWVLNDSMHELNKKHKEQIALIITGDGPIKLELEKSMPDNVIFTGYKKGNDLSEIYASCDIFAFPSSFETFGNVVLEAYASGLPVVGVSEGGVLELVQDYVTGFLSKPRDSKSFSSNLEQLITNHVLRHQCGINGRLFAQTKSWPSIITALLNNFNHYINNTTLNTPCKIDTLTNTTLQEKSHIA